MIEILRDIVKGIKCIVIVLLVISIFKIAFNFSDFQKQDINYASKADINACTGIGDKLSSDIYNYIHSNPIESVKDLEGQIKGIGEKRMQELEEVFK